MITGFNTDVPHEGRVYHVQTEDRGKENPVLESLVYVGGTIIAKKRTPYAERLSDGATEATIASLLKKQHQVIIAAIKAGRIEDLVRHSAKEFPLSPPAVVDPPPPPVAPSKPATVTPAPKVPVSMPVKREPIPQSPASQRPEPSATTYLGSPRLPARPAVTGGLNLDQVISDYIKRSSQQERLDLKVITPNVFTAGKSVGLKVQVLYRDRNEPDAIVTVKVIGTAFKPQVFVGRAGADGVASFNLNLPAFSAGTAAIVLEAQSSHGRGELKHLIRRS